MKWKIIENEDNSFLPIIISALGIGAIRDEKGSEVEGRTETIHMTSLHQSSKMK